MTLFDRTNGRVWNAKVSFDSVCYKLKLANMSRLWSCRIFLLISDSLWRIHIE